LPALRVAVAVGLRVILMAGLDVVFLVYFTVGLRVVVLVSFAVVFLVGLGVGVGYEKGRDVSTAMFATVTDASTGEADATAVAIALAVTLELAAAACVGDKPATVTSIELEAVVSILLPEIAVTTMFIWLADTPKKVAKLRTIPAFTV